LGKVRTAFLLFTKTSPSLALSASDIKFIRSLQQKKFRKEHGLFVVEGVKPVQELLSSPLKVETVYSTEPLDFTDTISVSEKELNRISGLKTSNQVLATAEIPLSKSVDWNKTIILFLDGINDPGNLGTIIRTAKWFGVSDIICSSDSVDAYDRKVVQSTMGALFHVNVVYASLPEIMAEAMDNGFTTIGTTMEGKSIYEAAKPKKIALIIGSESHGMRESASCLCNLVCSIPNFETEQKVESLNAGIATAIMLSELNRSLNA